MTIRNLLAPVGNQLSTSSRPLRSLDSAVDPADALRWHSRIVLETRPDLHISSSQVYARSRACLPYGLSGDMKTNMVKISNVGHASKHADLAAHVADHSYRPQYSDVTTALS